MSTQTTRTVCNRDCPDSCSLVVTVEDGRAVRLSGDPDDPVTRGFICERTNRFLARQYSEDRFRSPLVRRNGQLEPVSWDTALDLAAERLLQTRRNHGAESILHFRSGGSLGLLKGVSDHLFAHFGPVTATHGSICTGAGSHAQKTDFGISDSHDVFDLLSSKVILLWGKNPHTSGVHLLPVLREAKARGAVVIGVDPVRTKAASLCDEFLQPRPGADYALAMAMARTLFEEALVPEDVGEYCDGVDGFRELAFSQTAESWAQAAGLDGGDVRRVARLYGERKPGALLVGWGLGRRRNGSRTVRALDALGAISGNLGVAGGGVSFYFARKSAFDLELGGRPDPVRTFSETRLGAEMLAASPPIRTAWVTAGNPVTMLPGAADVRRAFEATDFVVVVDTHPTDTTDCADLVLPTLTLLEDDDVIGAYGNHWLRASTGALTPPGEARHEVDILQDLAGRLGLADVMAGSRADWKRRLLTRLEPEGVTLEDLERAPVRNPFAPDVLFADRVFPTPTGRVSLLTEPAAAPPESSPDFPLTLLAVSTPKAQSSQWSVDVSGPAPVRVHPDSAGDLADGAPARLESALGGLDVVVRHDERVHPTAALMEKGGMRRQGRWVNALIEAVETDEGAGAAYYDQPVRLVPSAQRL